MKKQLTRLAKIETKLNPPKFAGLEEILKRLDLEKQENLTLEEQQILRELEGLQIHPQLEKIIHDLHAKRTENDKK